MKNLSPKNSEFIFAFLWFLYRSGIAVSAGVLKVHGFLAFPINTSFTLCMRAQHRIVYSTLYGYFG